MNTDKVNSITISNYIREGKDKQIQGGVEFIISKDSIHMKEDYYYLDLPH